MGFSMPLYVHYIFISVESHGLHVGQLLTSTWERGNPFSSTTVSVVVYTCGTLVYFLIFTDCKQVQFKFLWFIHNHYCDSASCFYSGNGASSHHVLDRALLEATHKFQ